MGENIRLNRILDAYYILGRHLEIIKLCDAHLSNNPNDVEIIEAKIRSLSEYEMKKEILECYNKLIDLEPNNECHWEYKSKILVELGNIEEALVCTTNSLEINPKDRNNWTEKAKLLELLGRDIEALDCYNKALKIATLQWDLVSKAKCLVRLGKIEDALDCYELIFDFGDKQHVESYAWEGKISILSYYDRFEEVLPLYENHYKSETFKYHYFQEKGEALVNLGLFEEGIKFYERAIELEPENDLAKKELISLLMARGHYEKVPSIYKKLSKESKEDFIDLEDLTSWILMANSLRDQGKIDEALEGFYLVTELYPNNPSGWYHVGRILEEKGNYEDAIKYYNKTIELDPNISAAVDFKNKLMDRMLK